MDAVAVLFGVYAVALLLVLCVQYSSERRAALRRARNLPVMIQLSPGDRAVRDLRRSR